MAASKQTVGAIYMVLVHYVKDPAVQTALIHDLLQLQGNASFRKTMEALSEFHEFVQLSVGNLT
jgi:hypothetical protein